jgi:hypothetical protein
MTIKDALLIGSGLLVIALIYACMISYQPMQVYQANGIDVYQLHWSYADWRVMCYVYTINDQVTNVSCV